MTILFKLDFKEASNNCWKCKIYDEESEEKERDTHSVLANNYLTRIINDCEKIISNTNPSSKIYEDAIETKKIAEEAEKECRGCGYRDTKIKNLLEIYKIRSD